MQARQRAPTTIICHSQFGAVGVLLGASQGWGHFPDLIKY
jgi:hypothetical protein